MAHISSMRTPKKNTQSRKTNTHTAPPTTFTQVYLTNFRPHWSTCCRSFGFLKGFTPRSSLDTKWANPKPPPVAICVRSKAAEGEVAFVPWYRGFPVYPTRSSTPATANNGFLPSPRKRFGQSVSPELVLVLCGGWQVSQSSAVDDT